MQTSTTTFQENVAFYHENGYVLVKGLLSRTEAAFFRQECHDLAERLARQRDIEATWESARELNKSGTKTVLLHCHDVQFYSAAFSKLIVGHCRENGRPDKEVE